ncbi:MAG: hypothetical protein RLZZ271_1059 [Pseudomonadota bacterium]|jgi:hypothetical protein
MQTTADLIRMRLSQGPANARQLMGLLSVSQPTLWRILSGMGPEVLRFGAARSIQYVLRDHGRGLEDLVVYRVDAQGRLTELGTLVPVRPDGFVMHQADGKSVHNPGLPWWLLDMRPQGFLGRAYVLRHAQALGLSAQLSQWSDTDALRALRAHGHDVVGNLLLGPLAREQFLNAPAPEPTPQPHKGAAYALQAEVASRGGAPGSSAGGEQPKFAACIETSEGPQHVLVKFTLPNSNPVTQRWHDLLLAEHHALETLRSAGVSAARTGIVDHAGQRFLEVERFDRVGVRGRRAVFSLSALEAEFVGDAKAPWPAIANRLAQGGYVSREAAHAAAQLYAFGCLIGNTDMHNGNLSFVSEPGHPCELAPAYDMLPMGFAPRSGGALPDRLLPAHLHPSVRNAVWTQALSWAHDFLRRLHAEARFSADFQACLSGLSAHVRDADGQVARLG